MQTVRCTLPLWTYYFSLLIQVVPHGCQTMQSTNNLSVGKQKLLTRTTHWITVQPNGILQGTVDNVNIIHIHTKHSSEWSAEVCEIFVAHNNVCLHYILWVLLVSSYSIPTRWYHILENIGTASEFKCHLNHCSLFYHWI